MRYNIDDQKSILLSGGAYHNYSIPNYFAKNYHLQSSHQIALDYAHTLGNTTLTGAAYFKTETDDQADSVFLMPNKTNTFGLEMYIVHTFFTYFKFSIANSFIDQKITIAGENYNGAYDFNYLIKTNIQYNNPRLFSLAFNYISRPGRYYNEIVGGAGDPIVKTDFYIPLFSNQLYGVQYGNYNRFDMSLSKYIRVDKYAIILYGSINNIFNTKNQKGHYIMQTTQKCTPIFINTERYILAWYGRL